MKIINQKILAKNCFDEVTNPREIYEYSPKGLIGIAHSFRAQWSGRNIELQKELLSIYKTETIDFVAQIELKYKINDIDFHSNKNLIIIATGSYDGGCYYEGELILWDYKENITTKIIKNNREFTQCKFEDDNLRITVNPIHDLDCEDDENEKNIDDCKDEIYLFKYEEKEEIELSDLIAVSITEHTNDFDIKQYNRHKKEIIVRLNQLAERIGKKYEGNKHVWDIAFINSNKLAIALSDAKIQIIEVDSDKSTTIILPVEGNATQIFFNDSTNKLIVNIFPHQFSYKKEKNKFYEIDINTLKHRKIFEGSFSLSKTNLNEFLARQTDYLGNEKYDIIFDTHFNEKVKLELGHYDLFNHYIRIDNANNFYAFIGNPKNQHKNKRLIEIDKNFKINTIIEIEKEPVMYNNLVGYLINDIFVFSGKNYSISYNYEVFAYKKKKKNSFFSNKKELWKFGLSGQVTAVTKLNNIKNIIILTTTTREILVIDILAGKIIYNLTTLSLLNGYPLSIASIDNKIAIGYENGLIEIVEIE